MELTLIMMIKLLYHHFPYRGLNWGKNDKLSSSAESVGAIEREIGVSNRMTIGCRAERLPILQD